MSGGKLDKKASLWSYILPPAIDGIPSSEPIPATGPLDRNAVSVRLLLGDAKAVLQQLSDRVDKVLAESHLQVEHRVFEADLAHTSRLDQIEQRCVRLEAALASHSQATLELSAKCESSIAAVQMAMDRMLAHSCARTDLADALNVGLDRLRGEVGALRESWTLALSLHRQEITSLVSAIRPLSPSEPRACTDSCHVHANNARHDRYSPTGRVLVLDTPSTALSPVPGHTFEEEEEEEEEEEAAGSALEDEDKATFTTLNQRTRSTLADFATPDSPPFSIHRQPLQRAYMHALQIQSSHTSNSAQPAPSHSREPLDARAPTLGRSSPSTTLNKRTQRADLQPGSSKRPRKRTIIDSQDLLDSPER
ncbi:hypothetical protein CTheo_437 [Ceratobasidium theobromae]|uniref:Uncharacterized protein n=1 Tax=Ceratobasidium theobromae TaxID=1582974 RepID=A0A5N5QWQ2_9AGAM|nr:hypothetical protein CTheo_437 [Ceratobasidium theobromae]